MRPSSKTLALSWVVALCATTTLRLSAQDQFGASVAIDGNDVLVLKPSSARGPAGVYVYRRGSDGSWQMIQRLIPEAAAARGQGLNPSLSVAGGSVLMASADPEARLAAHAFRETAPGEWVESPEVSLMPAGGRENAASSWDLAALMRILQPAPRVLTADGDHMVAAVGSGVRSSGVHILERQGSADSWTVRGRLQPSVSLDPNDMFGAALAMAGDRVVVGAPRYGGTGAVFVFVRDPASGMWSEDAVLTPVSADSGSTMMFGVAVGLSGGHILVGAPVPEGTGGMVGVYAWDGMSGTWQAREHLVPADSGGGRFGWSLATHGDEVWVGAPAAGEGRGAVYRFQWDGATDMWHGGDRPVAQGDNAGDRLGEALAAGGDLAVAGSPGGDRAAVFARTAGGWSAPAWLDLAEEALTAVTGAEVRCDGGQAGRFTCNNVDLLSFLPIAELGGGPNDHVSDLWGWTDPLTGREYALVGRVAGAALVDITDPTAPVYLGVVEANRSGARDLKVYRDHLFFTGDGAGDHGLIVFDLTRLRDVRSPPVTFEPDARYDNIASAHNLVIDTTAGFAYPVGASGGGETCGGGLHMVDIRNPVHPTFAGCYTDTEGLIWPGRTHDAQCVVYAGPDVRYRGRQICLASNETALRIVDVTDKANPIPLAAATYPGISYVHQGWLSEDQRYFYLDDELDELVGQTDRTRTIVWDVAELDDPVLVTEYRGREPATDHNLYIKGDRMYQANYQAGLRVVDIRDPEHPVEVGYFDTTPYQGNPPGFAGAWTAYPFFASGTVIVSSMSEGLFILKPQRRELVQ
jgi:choice-of-anchor B domain-containing protein